MGFALKFLQWFIRGVQLGCSVLILGIFSYFLATLHNHSLPIATSIRAVEGISGAAVLYTLVGLLLLCCLAGRSFTSFIAIVIDVAFIGAFIYVAVANRSGASSCSGNVSTPFGDGPADGEPTNTGNEGWTRLPSLHTACKLQSACFAVSIIAIIFFILSILVEVALARHHHKEKRFGPSPKNNYTSGSGAKPGFFSSFRRRNRPVAETNENALPMHASPDQVRTSYATETTAVGQESAYPKYEGAYATNGTAGVNGYNHGQETGTTGTTQPPNNYRYNDGVYDRV
ncbi:hypothetical protein LZ32DRAFT_609142 [Colletotrichum eremochloae]|uniref:MARVEL domain-containing protein n=1 Tax=Colletotrichum sublineola TaxID=1173701 RepID=A0A066X3W4_COLSU|nr:hypothetical protein LY78DRAFT_659490 [Colletotrichum sublineola]KAK2008746.1 hypothetical protein LZ32DRAFT_609142 [Colletotrichum eremochloae]KDN63828.1 hypothetical protein CSUB01_04348 [Colletotrichum sublineola]